MSVHDTTVDIQNPPVIPVEVVFGTIKLGGGFKYVFLSPLFGEDSHFD